jgi:hypothetical protein
MNVGGGPDFIEFVPQRATRFSELARRVARTSAIRVNLGVPSLGFLRVCISFSSLRVLALRLRSSPTRPVEPPDSERIFH